MLLCFVCTLFYLVSSLLCFVCTLFYLVSLLLCLVCTLFYLVSLLLCFVFTLFNLVNNNNNICLKSNIQTSSVDYIGSSHMHVHAVTPKL